MMPSFISEDDIERALVAKLHELWDDKYSFESLNCHTTDASDLNDRSGRSDKRDVILADRVRSAAKRLNQTDDRHIPDTAIDQAVSQLTSRRSAMSMIAANRELDSLIRDGIKVEFDGPNGKTETDRVRLIDFDDPTNNDFLAVTQLWIKSTGSASLAGYRRPDVILYVNGIPLVFFELKNSNVKLKSAFDDNLTNYKKDIPQLFHAGAVVVLSNAVETKIGSLSATWEYFFHWLRPDDETEKIDRDQIQAKAEAGMIVSDQTSLERLVDGLLDPPKLLDYVENFCVYYKEDQKIIAQNHQFLGVNKGYDAFCDRDNRDGKLGVFWHTQGSGKSFSMIFYTRKIFRKQTGNFTFVVVTDRRDLDSQIYRNFLHTETVKKNEVCQPTNSEEMRKFLGQNKRMVFTLIQKFRWPKGQTYPQLTDRGRDIIVIVDEAHRSQYEDLAENMRAGLKGANFIAFTGTPLLGSQRKTNKWFGDYVSEYNFQQSMDDGATVPLVYEKRVPEMLIQNEDLSEEFYQLLEDEDLDDAQQEKLEKKFAKETEVIKRDDRLDTIAEDIVKHFPARGYLGKAMVISLDKFTAVKMYDKVQREWKEELKRLTSRISKSRSEIEKERLKKRKDWMKRVEMAVIVSHDASDEKRFQDAGLDIKPHRERMQVLDENGADYEDNFKDPNHPLQLVFVCAMWLTGFDAPTISTLYIDKPMKDHTLMQTIARANRVTGYQIDGKSKTVGELVDYYNVFRNMKTALNNYGTGGDGEEMPVKEKKVLFDLLAQAIEEATSFLAEHEIHVGELLDGEDRIFKSISLFEGWADTLLGDQEGRKSFYVYENTISSLYQACKPEVLGNPVVKQVAVFQYLRGIIEAKIQQQDIDEITRKIGELLDESLVVDESVKSEKQKYQIPKNTFVWDLQTTDFDKLSEEFKDKKHKNIEITDLLAFIQKKLTEMLGKNVTRRDFAEHLQEIVDRYNSGGANNENAYQELLEFAKQMKEEEERHVREGLTEDELELYDLIKNEKMTKAEEQKIKLTAKKLLKRLREEQPPVLVEAWFKDTQTRKVVRSAVEEILDMQLPDSYDKATFQSKSQRVFDTILDYAIQGIKFTSAA
jgi:type I restriction enzyme R subunit